MSHRNEGKINKVRRETVRELYNFFCGEEYGISWANDQECTDPDTAIKYLEKYGWDGNKAGAACQFDEDCKHPDQFTPEEIEEMRKDVEKVLRKDRRNNQFG